MLSKLTRQKSFTLVELLVTIAIIGLLSSIVLVNIKNVIAKARDTRRLHDMRQIVTALKLYYAKYERYPSISGDGCCDGWDQGPCAGDPFIGALVTDGLIQTPSDPRGGSGTGCYGYNYYRYSAGSYGCNTSKGAYFVLGVRDMETSGRPHPDSPGWSCPNRNWQNEFDWVVGEFED